MKSRAPSSLSDDEKRRDYTERLAELEAELGAHLTRAAGTASSALPSLSGVESSTIGRDPVVRFLHRGKPFAVGHADKAFPGTSGVRGVRIVSFYDAADCLVLAAAGEFDNQQFGANFRSVVLKTFHPGAWEEPFMIITTGLRTFRNDRKEELRMSRLRALGRRR